jgi:fucose 4-O-acetylase-like acetyltransferase
MQRDLKIDALKGFAILLVVLGHAIQTSAANFDNNIVFRIIYSFHIPLFMFLSGYIAYGRPINLSKKFTSLVIPFITWYMLLFLIYQTYKSVSFTDYIMRLVKSPDYGLWFLWVLFINFSLIKLCTRVPRYKDLLIILGIILIRFVPVNILGIGLAKWHFTFFAMGYLISKHRDKLLRFQRPVSMLAIIFFPILVSQWYRVQEPLFFPVIKQLFNTYHLRGSGYILALYTYTVPLLGITMAFLFIYFLSKSSLQGVLSKLGMLSLEIYVLHQNLLFGLGFGIVIVMSKFLIALLMSLVISVILKKFTVLSWLLFGKKNLKPRQNNDSASLAGLY